MSKDHEFVVEFMDDNSEIQESTAHFDQLVFLFKMSDYEAISTRQRVFLVTQGIFQFLLAVFVTSTIWLMAYNRNWQSMHTWHVFLSNIGFSFFMSEAIALLNPGNAFALGCNKLSRGFLHGVLMLFAAIAVIAGISIKIQDKNNNNNSHFYSTHGITGFVAYLMTMLSFILGLMLSFGKVLYKLFGIKPVLLRSLHLFFGIAAYVLGIVALGYGLRNYFGEASYSTNTGFIVILGIYATLNLIGPLKTMFRL